MECGRAIGATATPAVGGGGAADSGGGGSMAGDAVAAAEGATDGGGGGAAAVRGTWGETGACSTGRCPLLARNRAIRSSGVSSAMGHLRTRP